MKMGFFKPKIEKMRTRQDVEGLLKALNHKDEGVRTDAAKALGDIEDVKAVEVLIQALKDEVDSVRYEAAVALERLGWKPGDDTEKARYLIAKREWGDLAGLGGPAVESLIQALKDEDRDVRTGAAEALRKIGEPAVDPLIKALKDENSDVREVAAECLGEIGDARAVEPLIQALKHKDAASSVSTVEEDGALVPADGPRKGLSLIGERAVEPLIQALKDENPSLRYGAAIVLGAIRDARAVEPLFQILKDEDENAVWNANWALKSIGEPAMEPLLKDEDWHVRQAAAFALGVTEDARAVEPLTQALKDEEFRVRHAAASALEIVGDARAVEPLTQALKDENSYVREAAKAALEKIKAEKS